MIAVLLVVAAALSSLLPVGLPRYLAPLGLLAAAAVAGRRWWSRAIGAIGSSHRGTPRSRGLTLAGGQLSFQPGPGQPLQTMLSLDEVFGVTLLASPRRDRVTVLLSSTTGAFYVGGRFDPAARRAFAPLLDRCHTMIGDDGGTEAIGPDGAPLVLPPEDLASLVDVLMTVSPRCMDRLVLTDARGAAITLDGRRLSIGEQAVDLEAPLEWRSMVFQEALGQAIAVYQGTWIRQSGTEITLVSLLPGLGSAAGEGVDLGTVDRAVLRDLRLMQAAPETPPPSAPRVAIDRLFMLPLRSALDRAPRASDRPTRAQA